MTGLKKNLELSVESKRRLIEPKHPQISITRQCELLGFSRSGLYYKPKGFDDESLLIMRLLDEKYTERPYFGVRRMTNFLRKAGFVVGPKKVRRLLRLMGLEALYPKPKLSWANKDHKVFPYLLKGLVISYKDEVWSSDITYIRLKKGFVYLTAVMDWFSRYVIDWQISTTLEADFCVETLMRSLDKGRPKYFNTDQGSQYTSSRFTKPLLEREIQVSMDGKGRCYDNILIERLWRTVKWEKVYLSDFCTVSEAKEEIAEYFDFYNNEREHMSLENKTPADIYLPV